MTEFLQRLKQRKLVQWAIAYAAFAFALIQVLDVIAQRFAWPDQLERILILALAVGFLVVLVLAWYHGERGAQRVSGTEIDPRLAAGDRRRTVVAVCARVERSRCIHCA